MKFILLNQIKMNKQSGFTLLELLLYISIISIVLLVFGLFLNLILASRVKNQAIFEVESQGAQIITQMSQIIRNSDVINSPASGASASSLSLNTYDASKNPTVFDLSSGQIRIKEGAAAVKNLSSTKITASALTFKNLSLASTPGIITFQFTLTFINSSGRNEYSYVKTFYGSGSLR